MDSARPQSDNRHNIPHMQLFHHLKQKFPDLKDNDVNESIQKYGLDRERCEDELSQKTQLHHGGYYGPWGRSSSTLSSPTMSRVTSPIRTGIPSPPTGVPSTPTTPVLTTTTPTTLPVDDSTATHHVFGPLHSSGYLVYTGSYNPGTMVGGGPEPVYTSPTSTAAVQTSPLFYQPPVNSAISYGWHPSVSNGFRAAGVQPPPTRQLQGGYGKQDSPYGSREASKSRSSTPVMPMSAPVVPNSFDPFSAYEHKGPPERRRSAEPQYDARKGYQYNMSDMDEQYEILNHSPYSPTPPVNTMDSPSTPTTTTTTTLTTTTSSCTSPTTVNGSSSGRPPPVLVGEQQVRKERLEAEVARQIEQKDQLHGEVEMMVRELQAREHQRKMTADTNTMRIEDVQKENQRLQSECYEMENKILRLAPDLEPEFGPNLPSPQSYPDTPQPPHLPRASSGSSLGSGTSGTPQTPGTPQQHPPGSYLPTRPAPPPPLSSPATHNNTYHDYQGVGRDAGEDVGHKWGCSKCTFINHPDMNKCEICDYPRFTIGTAPHPPPHPPNHHHHSNSHQGPCYCHRNHHNHHSYTSSGSVDAGFSGAATPTDSCSSLPLSHDKPNLSNIIKEKLVGLRDRSDSV